MFSALILSLVAATPVGAPAASDAASEAQIRISLNNDRRFREGERGRVKVRVEDDGFLVVLHADTDGRVRVLFPLDPDDDNYVRGDRTYEIRGRGDRETFTAEYRGEGAIYAAISRDPFRFDNFVVNRHWDYEALNTERLPKQPEPELTELVQRMATGRFEYDYLTYDVYERGYSDIVYAPSVVHSSYYVDPYCSGYYFRYDCDPYYYGRNRYSVSITFGRSYYYRPYYYDPFYDPWYYGYGGYYYSPRYYPYAYPVYVRPSRPWGYSPYRPRYVSQDDFKKGNRTWDGGGYRVRSAVATDIRSPSLKAGDIRAVNTVYGEPPARRAVTQGDAGRSPVTQPSPSREVNASPSRRTIDEKPATTARPEGRRSRSEVETPRPNVERAPSTERRTPVIERTRPEREPEAERSRTERTPEAGRTPEAVRSRPERTIERGEPELRRRELPAADRSREVESERARPEPVRARAEDRRESRAEPVRSESPRPEPARVHTEDRGGSRAEPRSAPPPRSAPAPRSEGRSSGGGGRRGTR